MRSYVNCNQNLAVEFLYYDFGHSSDNIIRIDNRTDFEATTRNTNDVAWFTSTAEGNSAIRRGDGIIR